MKRFVALMRTASFVSRAKGQALFCCLTSVCVCAGRCEEEESGELLGVTNWPTWVLLFVQREARLEFHQELNWCN